MLQTSLPWQRLETSPDQTHHTFDQKPAYPARFLSVLKFHAPGLAPAKDRSGAFHINTQGEPAYLPRFLKTFGFYEELAAVESSTGWLHIFPDGSECYQNRFAWCGNFQQAHCPVKSFDKTFFHINRKGEKSYAETYPYVGDFKDGFAVVQNGEGLHSHIDFAGRFLHGKWFIDLDVYHKGFARAKDHQGWFHIDRQGRAIYPQRYKNIEPFYNGVARVETPLGALHLITEEGEKVGILRQELEDEFHHVSAELVSYWRFYTLQVANQLRLFDFLPNDVCNLSQCIDLPETSTFKLLRGLQEMGYVEIDSTHRWVCTSKGSFLQSNHPYTLKHAAALWGQEHLISWQNITYSLENSLPAFKQLFGKGWFEWLKDHPHQSQLYHAALSIYAQRDYKAFCDSINLRKHQSLLDVGGSTGTLLMNLLDYNPHLKGILLDLPNIIQLVNIPSHLKDRMECIPADFFEDWPSFQVESAVLSRVLHDWSDLEASRILDKVYRALSDKPTNRLYLIEKIQDDSIPQGALLDLNMLIMTGGVERTLCQFKSLLDNSGFILEKTLPLNQVSSVLIARKK